VDPDKDGMLASAVFGWHIPHDAVGRLKPVDVDNTIPGVVVIPKSAAKPGRVVSFAGTLEATSFVETEIGGPTVPPIE